MSPYAGMQQGERGKTMGRLTASYDAGVGGARLVGDTIGVALAKMVEAQPDVDALVSRHQGVRLSYGDLGSEVEAVARGLLAVGIEVRDRVGIWAPTCVEWTLLQFACARVGAILVNVNPAYRPNELAYALRHSGVRMLVTARSFKTSDYLSMLAGVRNELPQLELVVTIDGESAGGPKDIEWPALVELGKGISPDQVRAREIGLDTDDPINIQYTSGTTGNPKGATLTHHNIMNNAWSMASAMGYTSIDRVCIPVPLYHCFGMGIGNLGCIGSGATMVYPAASFEPLATLEALAEERCTAVYGVPTMFIAQLEHPRFSEFDLSSLRTGIMAGAPCPVEVMKRVIDEMHASEICIGYGMTETSPVSFLTRPDEDIDRRVSTVGTVLPNVEGKIVDPVTGHTVPIGTPGEVCTRGYLVMRGYWDNEEATHDAIDEAGWMHTGDLGVMDESGYLNIVGRIKDMVIRGGENLYPREIEELLFQHPAVASVQVIGVPDERMGEELMAWVVLREGAEVTADDLRTFCRERVAHFKVPRYVKFTTEFPMTVTGKVQKFKMREEAIEELGLQSAASIATA
ncbi:MAG TPA: AMP-binding protein [Acidimicrobiales bacterium]|nr:AMP-binding protein [Acidimicrobiales bacterium]